MTKRGNERASHLARETNRCFPARIKRRAATKINTRAYLARLRVAYSEACGSLSATGWSVDCGIPAPRMPRSTVGCCSDAQAAEASEMCAEQRV